MTEHIQESSHQGDAFSRRTIVRGAAWSLPVLATSVAVPIASASTECRDQLIAVFNQPIYTATAGTVFDTPVTVFVTDESGAPVPGASVTFTIHENEDVDDGDDEEDEDDGDDGDGGSAGGGAATATFPGGLTTVVVETDEAGYAAAPETTAGSGAGTLDITAVAQLTASGCGSLTSNTAESILRILSVPVQDITVWAWGRGSSGALGTGSTSRSVIPVGVQVPGSITNWQALSSEGRTQLRAFAVAGDGSVYGWGNGGYNNLGSGGSTSVPRLIPGLESIVEVHSGIYSSYALKSDGTVWAWGDRSDGAMGDGGGSGGNQAIPVQVSLPAGSVATQVSAGNRSGYALLDDGTVWSWGRGANSALGNGAGNRNVPAQVQLPAGRTATQIVGRRDGAFALLDDGTVVSWGRGSYGANGDGSTGTNTTPNYVTGISSAVAIFGGWNNGGAILADGSAVVWGYGSSYALGNNSTGNSTVPVPLVVPGQGSRSIVQGVYGDRTGHVLLDDGTVYGWGLNSNGQVGNGTRVAVRTPAQVIGLVGPVVQLGSSRYSTYALTA